MKNLSDDDIANIIYRSAKAARDQRRTASRDGDRVRFMAVDEQGRALFNIEGVGSLTFDKIDDSVD